MIERHNGFLTFGKASDLQARSRGEAWENLPFGFYAGPGPTAWRNVRDPMDMYVSAELETSATKKLEKERKKGFLHRLLTRDLTREAMRERALAQQMRER